MIESIDRIKYSFIDLIDKPKNTTPKSQDDVNKSLNAIEYEEKVIEEIAEKMDNAIE